MGRGEEMGKKSNLISEIKKPGYLPIIFGENIKRYKITFLNKYISEKEILKDRKIYDKKIVVRQLGEIINAAYDDFGYITIQSIYSIVPSPKYKIEFILSLLNSSLMNFVYQRLFKGKDLFPRILLESLRDLPIPKLKELINNEEYEKVIKKTNEINSLMNKEMINFYDIDLPH